MNNKKTENLRITRTLVPTVLETTFVASLNLAESMIVGTLGKNAVAALGLTMQPRLFAYSLISSINIGLTGVTSKLYSRNKGGQSSLLLRTVLSMMLILSMLVTLSMVLFPEQIIRLAGGQRVEAEPEIWKDAAAYVRIVAFTFPFQTIALSISAVLRGKGKANVSLLINLIACGSQILFGSMLISGFGIFPGLGLRGAAISSCVGWISGMIAALICGKKHLDKVPLSHQKTEFIGQEVKDTFSMSGYSAAEQIAVRIGYIVSGRILFTLGTSLFSANQICQQITSLIYAYGDGFAVTGVTLAGVQEKQNAERRERLTSCVKTALLSGAAIGIILYLLSYHAAGLFIRNSESVEDVLKSAGRSIKVIAVFIPFQTGALFAAGYLRGMGKNRYVAVVSIFATGLLRTVLIYAATMISKENLWLIWLMSLTEILIRFFLFIPKLMKNKKARA